MKKIILFSLLLFFICSLFSQTKKLDDTIICEDISLEGSVPASGNGYIYLYVDNKNNTYISSAFYTWGDIYVMSSRGIVTESERKEIVLLLEKSLNWCDIAVQEKIDFRKNMGTFYKEYGIRECGVNIDFSSRNKGKENGIIITIKDFSEPLYCVIFLNYEKTLKLIDMLKKVPVVYKNLKEEEKVLEKFK